MTAMVPVRCLRLMWLAASRDCRTIRPEMAALFRGNWRRQKPVMSGCRLQAGMNDCRRLPHSVSPPVWRQWLEREAGQAPAEMAGMPGPEAETGLRTATSGEGVPVTEAAGQKLLEAVVPMVDELLAKGRQNGRGITR